MFALEVKQAIAFLNAEPKRLVHPLAGHDHSIGGLCRSPTPPLRDGRDLHDLSAWTTYLFSGSVIYLRLYPRTSPIIIGVDRTARLD
jgi:hypothetical protein